MSTRHDIPTMPRERASWVLYQLKLRGLNISEIARRHGWHRRTVLQALHQPSYPQELAIAEALELPVEKLFADRYDARGKRLHPVKGSRRAEASQRSKEEAA